MNELRFPSGALVFQEGDPPDCAYLIVEGSIEIFTDHAGRRVLFDVIGPGEVFGEIAVLDADRRTATARALSDVRLLRIERSQLIERVEQSDPIIRQLLRKLLLRYRSTIAALRGEALKGPGSDEDDDRTAIAKISLESALLEALQTQDQLELRLQPILGIHSEKIEGYEALIRWHHPELGAIPPDRFIALAEETSLITAVGEFALRQGCYAAKAFAAQSRRVFISINVSARQLESPGFVAKMEEVMRETAVERRQIKIEITESQRVDYECVAEAMAALRGFGVAVVLDDFGTGFANLSHLHRLPFDAIKLDRSFIGEIKSNPRARAVVEAVVAIARALDAETVAEGVETREDLEEVRALGVRYAQGFYIGKPAPLHELL